MQKVQVWNQLEGITLLSGDYPAIFQHAFHSTQKMGEMRFDTSLLSTAWKTGAALNCSMEDNCKLDSGDECEAD